jgi:uncharacterized protein YndB with AHSA1/START domain
VERLERTVELGAPPQRVWDALTRAEELAAWFGAEVSLEPRPGGRAVFRFADGRERAASVEEALPPRRLSFRWLPFERDRKGHPHAARSTRVEFLLEQAGEGTRLTVVETPLLMAQPTGATG